MRRIIRSLHTHFSVFSVAALSVGLFLSYIPLTMLTKMSSLGIVPGLIGIKATSFEILPVYTLGNLFASTLFVTLLGWWKYATQFKFLGLSLPRTRWYTFISGICIIGQIITTLFAYSFTGISIVFAVLLMKGGVLMMAPFIDIVVKIRKRRIYWPSLVASSLSLSALLISFLGRNDYTMTFICALDIFMYLVVYFIRLSIMSRRAKSDDKKEKIGYFVEEQLATNFLLVLLVAVFGFVGHFFRYGIFDEVWRGIFVLPAHGFIWPPFVIAVAAVSAGLFGTLIFLDRRENTFCVAVNQSSSIFSGTVASTLLALFFGQGYPDPTKYVSVILIIAAIVFLTYRGKVEKKVDLLIKGEGEV